MMRLRIRGFKFGELEIVSIDPQHKTIKVRIRKLFGTDAGKTSKPIELAVGDKIELSSSNTELRGSLWQFLKAFLFGASMN